MRAAAKKKHLNRTGRLMGFRMAKSGIQPLPKQKMSIPDP